MSIIHYNTIISASILLYTECNNYLVSGENGVDDADITASSTGSHDGALHSTQYARISTRRVLTDRGYTAGAWVAGDTDTTPWLEVCVRSNCPLMYSYE